MLSNNLICIVLRALFATPTGKGINDTTNRTPLW